MKIKHLITAVILSAGLFLLPNETVLPRLTINQSNYVVPCEGLVYAGITINGNNNVIENCTSKDALGNIGGIAVNGDNNQILNNNVKGSCMAGVIVRGNNNLIQGNDISGSRQCGGSGADADGIRVFNNGNRIINNNVYGISLADNPTAHIDCIQSWGTLTNTLIQGNYCNVAHAGVQTDSGYKVTNLTITGNVFITSRPLNVYCDGCNVTSNVFIGRVVTGFNGAFVSFRDSVNITFTNNVVLNTTDGILTRVGATTKGGNNVFWNDSGVAPRRDGGYNGQPSNLKWKSDKWQTVNPMLDADYFTGNLSLCYAGLGCAEVTPTATPTKVITQTAIFTLTPTITPTATVRPTTTPQCYYPVGGKICFWSTP